MYFVCRDSRRFYCDNWPVGDSAIGPIHVSIAQTGGTHRKWDAVVRRARRDPRRARRRYSCRLRVITRIHLQFSHDADKIAGEERRHHLYQRAACAGFRKAQCQHEQLLAPWGPEGEAARRFVREQVLKYFQSPDTCCDHGPGYLSIAYRKIERFGLRHGLVWHPLGSRGIFSLHQKPRQDCANLSMRSQDGSRFNEGVLRSQGESIAQGIGKVFNSGNIEGFRTN